MARGFIPPLANGEGRLARGFLLSRGRSDPPPPSSRQIQSIRRRNTTATPPAMIAPIVMA